ncbi:hypothetical protein [Leisingera sp. S232]|uniref:hypothetical protein n=1 Tax=Leisingera sp. S232 TaxID=3415132 RepID=UPI003C7DEC99
MAEEPLSGPEIKKIISKSRKKPVNFAFNPGKDDADGYLLLHLKKAPKILGKQAKSEGEGGKAAFGTFETEGKVIKLDCELSIPALSKKLKKYLKTQKISMAPVVLGEEDLEAALAEHNTGEDAFEDEYAEEDGGEEDGGDKPDSAKIGARVKEMVTAFKSLSEPDRSKLAKPVETIVGAFKAGKLQQVDAAIGKVMSAILAAQSRDSSPTQEDSHSDRAALEAQLKELAGRVKQLGDPQKTQFAKAVQTLAAALKAGELGKLPAGLAKLQQALDKAAPKQEPDGEEADANQTKYMQLFNEMDRQVQAALRDNRFPDEQSRKDFLKVWKWGNNNAADGIYDKAVAALERAKGLLDTALASEGAEYAADVPTDVKPFAVSRLKWQRTRSTMQSELKKLQAAIRSVCDGDPELQTVADSVGELDSYLSRLDERLSDKLDEVVNAEPGNAREDRKTEARSLLKEYQSELSTEFFQAVDGGNGFTNVAIASTAAAALSEIESTLK